MTVQALRKATSGTAFPSCAFGGWNERGLGHEEVMLAAEKIRTRKGITPAQVPDAEEVMDRLER